MTFKSVFHFIIILYTFQLLFRPGHSQNIKCNNKTRNKNDQAIAKLLVVGQKNIKFPENAQQLRPYCNLAQRTSDNINRYIEKCLPSVGRDTAKVLMHSITNEIKAVCKPGRLTKKAQELLNAAVCANGGLINWHRCYMKLLAKLTGLLNAKEKMRIPMACCNFHEFLKCLYDEAEDVKACTRKTADYVNKYIFKVISPITTLMCSEYSEPSDRCDRIVTITPNMTSTQPKYKSVFLPLIDLTLTLDDCKNNKCV